MTEQEFSDLALEVAEEFLSMNGTDNAFMAKGWIPEFARALMKKVQEKSEPDGYVLYRRDEDGLEAVMYYTYKPEGEFKERFELRPYWHTHPAIQPSLKEYGEKVREAAVKLCDKAAMADRRSNETLGWSATVTEPYFLAEAIRSMPLPEMGAK